MNHHRSTSRPASWRCLTTVAVGLCWLAGAAAGQEAEASKPKTAAAAVQAEGRLAIVYRLKHADVQLVMMSIGSLVPDAQITLHAKANSLIVLAPRSTHDRVVEFLKLLDVPPEPVEPLQLKVFLLVNAPAADLAEMVSGVFGSDDMKISADLRTNSLIAQGPEADLNQIEALLLRLDQQGGREGTIRVRVVWLAGGVADDAGTEPSDELNDVLAELDKVGVRGLRQVGQTLVSVVSGVPFQVSCQPQLGETPAPTEMEGVLNERHGTPMLDIDISSERISLHTEIIAPYGQYVVLGSAPTENMTSVFVVQVIPSGAEPPPPAEVSGADRPPPEADGPDPQTILADLKELAWGVHVEEKEEKLIEPLIRMLEYELNSRMKRARVKLAKDAPSVLHLTLVTETEGPYTIFWMSGELVYRVSESHEVKVWERPREEIGRFREMFNPKLLRHNMGDFFDHLSRACRKARSELQVFAVPGSEQEGVQARRVVGGRHGGRRGS